MLAAFWASQGVEAPVPAPVVPEPIVCELCETELDDPDELTVEIEGPAPQHSKRHYHAVCLTMHLVRNEDTEDELVAYITRKIPCSTAP